MLSRPAVAATRHRGAHMGPGQNFQARMTLLASEPAAFNMLSRPAVAGGLLSMLKAA